MYDSINLKSHKKYTLMPGPIYFRMWMHIFDFKNKQDSKSALIDLSIYYVILIAFMFLYRWITTFFMGYEVLALWLIFYFVSKIIPLSTYARVNREAGYPWWFCFFIFIPLLRLLPVLIVFVADFENSKPLLITLTIIIDIFLTLALPIRVLLVDEFMGDILVNYSTNVSDYEKCRNNTYLADKHLPETIEGFGNPKEIKFGYKEISSSRLLNSKFKGISLFASYGDDYLDEKERVLNTYEFATYEDVKGVIGFDSFSYNNYTFYIGKIDGSYSFYAEELFMIGFDDSNGYISYLYYYDYERHSITYSKESEEERLKELYEFMDKSFVWLSF